jgi:AraC family transcriptional regulator
MTVTYEIRDQFLAERHTAVVRAEVARNRLPEWLRAGFRDVAQYLRGRGVRPAGPPFARYAVLGDVVAVEAGFPVAERVPGKGRVLPSRLPGGRAVVTSHVGWHDGREDAYVALRQWLMQRRRTPDGARWEIYHVDPTNDPDPARWQADVVVPYRIGFLA